MRKGDDSALDGKGRRGGERCVLSLLCCFVSGAVAGAALGLAVASRGLLNLRADISGSCGAANDGVDPKKSCDWSAGEVTVGGLESRIEDSYLFMPGRASRGSTGGVEDE